MYVRDEWTRMAAIPQDCDDPVDHLDDHLAAPASVNDPGRAEAFDALDRLTDTA